jgi:hypothetical protein
MFAHNACRFVLFLFLSLSANATPEVEKEPKVTLGTAGNYAILAASGITNVATSVVTGNIAVSPIASGAMTGWTLILDLSGTFSTSAQITGKVYAASYATPTPTELTSAVGAMETAYTNAAGRTNANAARINYGAGTLGGNFGGAETQLTPGVYTFGTGVSISADIYFKGTGLLPGQGDTDVFIIQISGNLLEDANINVVLEGGAQAKNIFWQVAGNVALMAGAHMEGILLVKTDVTFVTGSSLNGRVLSQTACNLQKATVIQPVEVVVPVV